MKNRINQKRDIKKQKINNRIQKATLDYDFFEEYAAIKRLQENQTKVIKKGQKDQTRAIEDQSKILETFNTPAIKSPMLEPIEATENEENVPTKAFDGKIFDMISYFWIRLTPTHRWNFQNKISTIK